jgi:hypothetical protein
LFSETPPDSGPIIDDNFVELVWHWVSRNSEVRVEGEFQSNATEPNSTGDGNELATTAGSKLDGYRKQRLCTGEDRVWYAIAGHGIDYKRIPFLEFQALSVIAAQGTKGVLQPDVTKLTGQDKRSLPKRTDNLAKNGYIVKSSVIARGTKTSLLKLKKFAGDNDAPEDEGAAPIIQYNLWFDEMMRLLRENDSIMAFEDIRIGLGINKKRFETRALHRCVRRLARVGCLRKVSARVEAPASQPDADMKSVRSLQLLREPTEIDRVAFMRTDWQRSKLLASTQVAQFVASGVAEDDDEDIDDAEAVAGADGEVEDVRRILHRLPPVWNPDMPFPNFLYNRIKEAGIAGTSSSELYEDSVGQFWKRAMDEMLVKLTDLWQFSQPPHLRHLAIVKDTCQRGKQPTFQYRTHDNFEKAVVIGDAFWEGVFGPEEKGKGKAKQKKAEAAAAAPPDVDKWGFQKVNPKLFVGQVSTATLEECRRNAKPALQSKSVMTTPGSLVGRRPKGPKPSASGIGRPKKQQAIDQTPKSRPQNDQTATVTPARKAAKQKLPSAAALKRSAAQAELDMNQDLGRDGRSPEVERSQAPGTALGAKPTKERPRKSLRADNVPVASSPTTPALGKRPLTRPVALDGSPVAKRRKYTKKNTAEETEALRDDTNVESEAQAVAGASEQPVEVNSLPNKDMAGVDDWSDGPVPFVEVEAGVEINPEGSFELKKRTFPSRGRPPKAKIAVFKSTRLRDFSWYVRELPPAGYELTKAARKLGKAQRKPKVSAKLSTAEQLERTLAAIRQAPPEFGAINDAEVLKRVPSNEHVVDQVPDDAPLDPAAEVAAATEIPADTDMAEPETTAPDVDPTLIESTAGHASNAPLPDMTINDTGDDETGVRQYKKSGVTKSIGGLHIKRRKVAMDIVRACGGVFPGKGEMWFPFVTEWHKQHKQTPDRHTVDNVMKGLVNSGRVKKLTFYFKSRKGMTVERSIYVEPGIDPNSPNVKALQKKIIDTYPAIVLPDEVEISPEYRRQVARNPQATHHAKLARAAGEDVPPATDNMTVPVELPPHYIRDEFPEDASLTVRRTGNGVGLGAIDAQLRSIKQSRKLASLKRGRSKKTLLGDSEMEDGVAELTYEQALLQSEQDPSAYVGSAVSKRTAARLRGSGPGGRKLPGRILGSKVKRAANAQRTPAKQTKNSLPWDAIGYVASQAAHSFVELGCMAVVSKPKPPPKRIGRVQWKWVDPSAEKDWDIQPTGVGSDDETTDIPNNESASFGLLLPDYAHVVDSNGLSEKADVQFAPQTIEDIVNSHLLPSSPESGSDQNEATRFFNEVERVSAWEHHVIKAKQALARGEERPFINYTTPSDIPWAMDTASASETPRTRSGKRAMADDDAESPKAERQRKPQAARVAKKLQAELDPRKYKKRDRRAAANFGDAEHDRLAKAVALVSVVAGGLSYRRNWLIVAHAFGYQFESEFLRHRWDKVRDSRDPVVKQMQAQIWEPFLHAYENDILPEIDYDDLEGTDWPALMEWLENEVLTTSATDYSKPAAIINKVPDLPATNADLRSQFLLTETTGSLAINREDFFTAAVDKRRKDVATTNLNGLPLTSSIVSSAGDEANELLRSWTRAVVLTDDKNYNAVEAYKKIQKFGNKVLDDTMKDLVAEKILQVKKKGRRLPGRNLKLDDSAFLPMFKRWSDKQGPEHLFLARVAKRRAEVLDVLQNQEYYELAYSAEDELYVVLTNMVGQGLLKITARIPERNDDFDAPFPKITAWGYSGYNYNVRTFDKNRLRFSIIYEKTDKFTFEHGLKNTIPIPIHPPQFANEDGHRIPLWIDIHDHLLPRMWEMVFRSVLNLVVFRPGITAADIEEAHKGKIWAWEAELLMKWMEETGVAERVGPGEEVDGMWKGGWKVGEWWYCCLCPDVAKWQVLNE